MRFSLHVLYAPQLPDLLFFVKTVRIIFEFLQYMQYQNSPFLLYQET